MRGLLLGKFMPLHKGHYLLIDMALNMCDELHIFICSRIEEDIPGTLRYQWLQTQFPMATVHHITKELPQASRDKENAPNIWGDELNPYLEGKNIDYVFASEYYGFALASYFNATWVPVDPYRSISSISGQDIRTHMYQYWDHLVPVVQSYYTKIIGVQGDTSLIHILADKIRALLCDAYSTTIDSVLQNVDGYSIDISQFSANVQAEVATLRTLGYFVVLCHVSQNLHTISQEYVRIEQSFFDENFVVADKASMEQVYAWWEQSIHLL